MATTADSGELPKPTDDRSHNTLHIPLTPAEMHVIDECAKAGGLDTITWARFALILAAKPLVK